MIIEHILIVLSFLFISLALLFYSRFRKYEDPVDLAIAFVPLLVSIGLSITVIYV